MDLQPQIISNGMNYQFQQNSIFPKEKEQSFRFTFQNVAFKLFSLETKLSSSELNEVQSALRQVFELFEFLFSSGIHQVRNNQIFSSTSDQKIGIESINPIITRLMDLLLNAKIFAFKNRVIQILAKFSQIIKQTFPKEQIVQYLARAVKGVDEYTRIMASQIIPKFTQLFQKDLIAFEYIIHKVQYLDQLTTINCSSIMQGQNFTQCLRTMLSQSRFLSSLLIKALEQQVKLDVQIECSDVLKISNFSILTFYSLCLSLNLSKNEYLKVFESLIKIYKRRENLIIKCSQKLYRSVKSLLRQLFLKFFNQNFKIINLVFQMELEDVIQIDQKVVLRNYLMFDSYQQNYIIETSPLKLQHLLTKQKQKIDQKPILIQINPKKEKLIKVLKSLNQFTQSQLESTQVQKSIRLKIQRLIIALEYSKLCKLKDLSQLIKLWIQIYELMSSILSGTNLITINKLKSIRQNIKILAKDNESHAEVKFDNQIKVLAEIFLSFEDLYQKDKKFSLNQKFWSSKFFLDLQHRHMLKWTYLEPNTIDKLLL